MYYLIVTWEVINIVYFFRISHRFSFLFGVFSFVCLRAVSFVPFVRVSRLSHSLLFVFVLYRLSHLSVSLDCLILFCLCLRAVSFVPFVRVSRFYHSLLFVFVLCLLSHLPVSLDCLILDFLFSIILVLHLLSNIWLTLLCTKIDIKTLIIISTMTG